MDWTKIETMDPNLLVGVINTALRNHFDSLQELCKTNDVDQTMLCERLKQADYEYLPAANQFR